MPTRIDVYNQGPTPKKNGYQLVSEEEKNRLLKKYWSIPDRQVEASVVLEKR